MKNITALRNKLLSFNLKLSNKNGFTLIELLAVFSLITIVSGIGFASLVSYSRSQTLTQADADLKQGVETARFNALSNVKPASCIASNSQLISYTLIFCYNGYNPSSACTGLDGKGYVMQASCGGVPIPIMSKNLPQNVTFSTTSTCQSLTFGSTSQSISGIFANSGSFPCNLIISLYGKLKTITINSGGYASN